MKFELLMEELLDTCVEMRRAGKSSHEIKGFLSSKNINADTIQYLLRESDSIFLSSMIEAATPLPKTRSILWKSIALISTMAFLVLIFLGYFTISVVLLFIMYGVLRNNGVLGPKSKRPNMFDKFE